MSARLPGVSEPVTSARPSARAPSIVAISRQRRNVSAGRSAVSEPSHGMPRFQATFIASNRFTGAIEVASIDNETVTPASSIRSSAARASPGVAEAQLGVDRVAQRRAGPRHRLAVGLGRGEEVGDEEVRAEVAALLEDRRADRGRAALDRVDRDRQAALERVAHLGVEHRHLAEVRAAQVDAEVDEPVERRRRPEPLVAHPVDVGEVEGLVDRQHVAVAVRVARPDEAVAMGPQLGVGVRRACACCGPSRGPS